LTQYKFVLDENDIPKKWYNIVADMPEKPDPLLHPQTKEPTMLPPPLFAMGVVEQEASEEKWISIPEEVRDAYRLWRPTPLYRAVNLEKALKTPAKIYYKWEGVSPPGSHKPNTAVAQAYYAMKDGAERLTTETGAGQWGSSLSFATALFDLDCTVYMVRVSYNQKPYRRLLMHTWGAEVFPSPSDQTDFGKKMLGTDPEHPGSLGIAISEALEDAFKHENAKYSIGSVVNHVLLHQTVIGLEMKKQFEMAEDYPDVMYGCVGGGSNYSGAVFPFVGDKLTGKSPDLDVISCEPTACPTLTRGIYAYDYGDTAGMAPIAKMYTLGHDFVPPPIHAGGLRYHGDAPVLCKLQNMGVMRAEAYHQKAVFDAAIQFARTEGFVVAPETAHCVKGAIDEAIRCRETGEEKTIFFANSGHGHFDLAAYESYFGNKLEDFELPQAEIDKALKSLPQL